MQLDIFELQESRLDIDFFSYLKMLSLIISNVSVMLFSIGITVDIFLRG